MPDLYVLVVIICERTVNAQRCLGSKVVGDVR